MENFLINRIEELHKQNIKLKIIGVKNFSAKLNKLLKLAEKKTFKNNQLQINLALNYGSKSELINAFKLIKKNGKMFKSFRGMGSVGAMNKGSADRYFQTKQKDNSKYVPEGVEGFVKYKGKVSLIIYKLIGGLKSSMGYLGSKVIVKLRTKANFVKITKAGFYESMVHNVDMVKNDDKY